MPIAVAGVNLKAVQAVMGHRTIAMIMRYAHLAPNHLESVMETIPPEKWPLEWLLTPKLTSR
jgi:site-specific recombinase XerD